MTEQEYLSGPELPGIMPRARFAEGVIKISAIMNMETEAQVREKPGAWAAIEADYRELVAHHTRKS